jgi:hypothetical protein
MRILEDSCRCQKGRKGEVRSQRRIVLNGALSKTCTLEPSAGPLTEVVPFLHHDRLEDSGPMGDLTYCARDSVIDASLDPESSVNCLPGGRISDDGPGEKAYEGALTAFSGSLVTGTSNIRCLLLTLLLTTHHNRHTGKTRVTIPATTIPVIAPIDSSDELAGS